MVINEPIIDEITPHLVLGARLEADIKRRVRELESRAPRAMTNSDKRELSRLRELLRLAKQGSGLNDRSAILMGVLAAAMSGAIVGMFASAIGAVLAMITWPRKFSLRHALICVSAKCIARFIGPTATLLCLISCALLAALTCICIFMHMESSGIALPRKKDFATFAAAAVAGFPLHRLNSLLFILNRNSKTSKFVEFVGCLANLQLLAISPACVSSAIIICHPDRRRG